MSAEVHTHDRTHARAHAQTQTQTHTKHIQTNTYIQTQTHTHCHPFDGEQITSWTRKLTFFPCFIDQPRPPCAAAGCRHGPPRCQIWQIHACRPRSHPWTLELRLSGTCLVTLIPVFALSSLAQVIYHAFTLHASTVPVYFAIIHDASDWDFPRTACH
jgi:hypothetical protein